MSAIPREHIQHYVRILLEEKARDILMRSHEDYYYGWVEEDDGRGHWIGQAHEQRAKQRLYDAELQAEQAHANAIGITDPSDPAQLALAAATKALDKARKQLDRITSHIDAAIEKRRELRVRKLVTQLFLRYYRRARTHDWPLYDPGVPADIRDYVARWKDRPTLTPTSLVFLWLVIEECRDHATTFSLQGMGNTDWLAKSPLIQSGLDTDACEDEPSYAQRQYVKFLQRKDTEPAHENHDPRDILEGYPYDGPRDDDGDRCPTCQGFQRLRTIDVAGKYLQAIACDHWATTCAYDVQSPSFTSKQALRDHLTIEGMLAIR